MGGVGGSQEQRRMKEVNDNGRNTGSGKERLGKQKVGLRQLRVGSRTGVSQLACEAARAGDKQVRTEGRKKGEEASTFPHFIPSPAGDSGKHNRLDSGNQPYASAALLGVMGRQSGAPGPDPCRLQGRTNGSLSLRHCYPKVLLPGCLLAWAGGHLLAPCHPAGWNLTSSPHIRYPSPSLLSPLVIKCRYSPLLWVPESPPSVSLPMAQAWALQYSIKALP